MKTKTVVSAKMINVQSKIEKLNYLDSVETASEETIAALSPYELKTIHNRIESVNERDTMQSVKSLLEQAYGLSIWLDLRSELINGLGEKIGLEDFKIVIEKLNELIDQREEGVESIAEDFTTQSTLSGDKYNLTVFITLLEFMERHEDSIVESLKSNYNIKGPAEFKFWILLVSNIVNVLLWRLEALKEIGLPIVKAKMDNELPG